MQEPSAWLCLLVPTSSDERSIGPPHTPTPPPAFAMLSLFNFSCRWACDGVSARFYTAFAWCAGNELQLSQFLFLCQCLLHPYCHRMFSLDTDAHGGCFPPRPAECPAFVQCSPWLRAQGSPVPHRSTFLGLPKPQLLLARHCEVTTFSCGAPPRTPAGTGAGPTELTSRASFSLKDSSPCRLERAKSCLTQFVPFFS